MTFIPDLFKLFTQALLIFLQSEIPEPEAGFDPTSRAAAVEAHAAIVDSIEDAGKEHIMTAPFLVADREAREVLVFGEMTGMILGDPVEFFVITDMSGQDYEALMITWVTPSELHAALEFIGLEPGGAVNTNTHRLWPRGDSVDASLIVQMDENEEPREIPAHEWITRPDGEIMEYMPWVFTGAPMLPHPQIEDKEVYGADQFSPHSIASTFNLHNTMFDLPVQGAKTAVYGLYNRNKALETRHGQPVILRLRPTPEDRRRPERDHTLTLPSADPAPIESLMESVQEAGSTLFWVTPDFGPELTLADLRLFANKLNVLEQEEERIRIEPPVAGQLYYQAFAPPERFRERSRRPSQPLEIHLHREEEGFRATLFEIQELWDETRTPTLVEERRPLDTPAEWLAYLEANDPLIRVLFVFAPDDIRHEDLNEWLSEVYSLFPVIYVYGHN
ncbi:MAG: hypothetical protein JJU05_14880 [Verrucomicrobia bacterium]|nr:hypothetical protein [Verrucomicrobiota bacterium]MCH8527872.1 YdjY domain-containing protein [Kiritimatiellia bacterium]